jgi:hypothetical protein
MNSQLFALIISILDDGDPARTEVKNTALILTVLLTLFSGLDYFLKAGRYLDVHEEI